MMTTLCRNIHGKTNVADYKARRSPFVKVIIGSKNSTIESKRAVTRESCLQISYVEELRHSVENILAS